MDFVNVCALVECVSAIEIEIEPTHVLCVCVWGTQQFCVNEILLLLFCRNFPIPAATHTQTRVALCGEPK